MNTHAKRTIEPAKRRGDCGCLFEVGEEREYATDYHDACAVAAAEAEQFYRELGYGDDE